MDFGLARVSTSEMTQDGIVLGTPNYMSPEQALGDKVDGRSDVFSTGAVLYEMLTGHKPFEADSTPSVLFQVVHRQPPPVRRWAPDVPTAIVAVVNRSLEKDREKRFASAADMRAAVATARQARGAGRGPEGASAPAPPATAAAAPASDRGAGPDATPRRLRRAARAPAGARPDVAAAHEAHADAPDRRDPAGRTHGTAADAPRRRRGRRPPARGDRRRPLAARLVRAGADREPEHGERRSGRSDAGAGPKQVQLARRELEDKHYAAATAEAEGALKLLPGHPDAAAVLAAARDRVRELDRSIAEAHRLLRAGDTTGASRELSHVLELDPRHPAAAELSARLNSVFRAQADEAAASMREARSQALAAGVTARSLRSVDAGVSQAELLVARRRVRRRHAHLPRGARRLRQRAARRAPATRADAGPGRDVRGDPPARPRRHPTAVPRAPATPAEAAPPAPEPTATPLPARTLRRGRDVVATPAAGGIEGFDSTDVSSRRTPQFVGRIEFEVLPPAVRPGEPFVVRIHLRNDGRRAVQVRAVSLATVVDGRRDPAPVKPLQREVPPQSRALVAEYSGVWSGALSWALEAVVTSDRNETISSRLRSN